MSETYNSLPANLGAIASVASVVRIVARDGHYCVSASDFAQIAAVTGTLESPQELDILLAAKDWRRACNVATKHHDQQHHAVHVTVDDKGNVLLSITNQDAKIELTVQQPKAIRRSIDTIHQRLAQPGRSSSTHISAQRLATLLRCAHHYARNGTVSLQMRDQFVYISATTEDQRFEGALAMIT